MEERKRDELGRFVEEHDDYWETRYKVVWRPNRHKDYVLERREELYWYQKVYVWGVLGLAGVVLCGMVLELWQGVRAIFFL